MNTFRTIYTSIKHQSNVYRTFFVRLSNHIQRLLTDFKQQITYSSKEELYIMIDIKSADFLC